MSVIVLKRRFEAPPSKDEILNLLVGDNVGDKGKAKEALGNLLAPMKDLLSLYQFVDNLDSAAGKYADMLKEQEAVQQSIDSLKTQTVGAQKTYTVAANKLKSLDMDIVTLENKKLNLIQEIEDEETAKLRVNELVSAEYDRARGSMLVKLADEEKAASKALAVIEAKVKAAQDELDALAEKKRKFIASLG